MDTGWIAPTALYEQCGNERGNTELVLQTTLSFQIPLGNDPLFDLRLDHDVLYRIQRSGELTIYERPSIAGLLDCWIAGLPG